MVFKNHIAYRFLTDEKLIWEMCESTHPKEWKKVFETVGITENDVDPHLFSFYHLISPARTKTYYITDSVLDKFNMLKVDCQANGHFNWSVFAHNIPHQKYTFILSGNRTLRIYQAENVLNLFWLTFKKASNHGPEIEGQMHWVMNWLDRDTGELCTHFDHLDTIAVEELMYKLMCFFFLTENDEEIIPAGRVVGTKKTGKVLNDFKFPVIMVNSRWNTTTIRTEGFDVSGHFRVSRVGEGRKGYRIVFIEPFRKHGYKRSAGKLTSK